MKIKLVNNKWFEIQEIPDDIYDLNSVRCRACDTLLISGIYRKIKDTLRKSGLLADRQENNYMLCCCWHIWKHKNDISNIYYAPNEDSYIVVFNPKKCERSPHPFRVGKLQSKILVCYHTYEEKRSVRENLSIFRIDFCFVNDRKIYWNLSIRHLIN